MRSSTPTCRSTSSRWGCSSASRAAVRRRPARCSRRCWSRRVRVVPGLLLRGADLGHAARGRRLRLAEPDPRRGIGFVLAVTGWWFILWYWTPVYANILNVEVLQPLAALLKWDSVLTWLGSDTGIFIVCLDHGGPRGLRLSRSAWRPTPRSSGSASTSAGGLAGRHVGMLFSSERRSRTTSTRRRTTCSARAATPTTARSRLRRRAATRAGHMGFSPFFGRVAAADPDPVLLDPLSELGRHALRRGPRRERLPRRSARHDVPACG